MGEGGEGVSYKWALVGQDKQIERGTWEVKSRDFPVVTSNWDIGQDISKDVVKAKCKLWLVFISYERGSQQAGEAAGPEPKLLVSRSSSSCLCDHEH